MEDHVDLSRRTSIQLVEQKQTAPGYDTAAIQLADEHLRSSHARQLAGSERDSARTDGVPLHGQDSAAEGLTMVAQVSFATFTCQPARAGFDIAILNVL